MEANSFSDPLYTMNPLTRFAGREQDYANYRPSYPKDAIAQILQSLILQSPNPDLTTCVAADIGAGTGISSRLLAEHGLHVWAIEPNAAMRSAAPPHERITFLARTAEDTGLEPNSVDLVTCFQAFHWFNPTTCLPEFRRILKPTGILAVVWNNRDRSDPLTQEYSNIVQRLSKHHPAEQRMVAEAPLFQSSEFLPPEQYQFSYSQPLDLPGLIGRARSVSYISHDEETQQQLVTTLEALYHRFKDVQNQVFLAYTTEVFLLKPNRF